MKKTQDPFVNLVLDEEEKALEAAFERAEFVIDANVPRLKSWFC